MHFYFHADVQLKNEITQHQIHKSFNYSIFQLYPIYFETCYLLSYLRLISLLGLLYCLSRSEASPFWNVSIWKGKSKVGAKTVYPFQLQFFFSFLSNCKIISCSWKLGTKVYYLKHFLRDILPHLSYLMFQKSMSPKSSIKKHARKCKMYTFNLSNSIKDAVLHELPLKASFLLLKFLGTTVILSVGLPEHNITKN